METLERLGPRDLRQVMVRYRDALRAHQEAINRLNVYPVPDGDTGTNMALTLESVVGELESLDGAEPAMASTCAAIGHGSLMGARGNSGVILSQILRGMTSAMEGAKDVGAPEVAAALAWGSVAARQAVMRPVEGTILTVAEEAAHGAQAAASPGADLVGVLEAARTAASYALERTPELLPVLAHAGVVDAGGAGFVLLLDALLAVAAGRPLPAPRTNGAVPSSGEAVPVGDLRYEVMYLLEAPDEAVPAFKEVWAGIGDSIVVVGADGLWNCHIHTDDVGAAIEAALDAGRPRRILVTDLADQVDEERWVRQAEASSAGTGPLPAQPLVSAVVAVATGEGIRRIFRSLGVHQIVAGGQSMNPSTAQILDAVETAPAEEVVVLPNNLNILAVAEQVEDLTAKAVTVVPTAGIAEGFAALLEYDPQAGAADNAVGMALAARRVVAGEVTRAVRAAACEAGPVAEGDWLGLTSERVEVIEESPSAAATALLQRLLVDSHEIVTLIEGEGASAAETRRITEWLSEARPDVAVEVHHGGQPFYSYLLSVE